MPITMDLLERNRVIYYRVTSPTHLGEVVASYPENEKIRDQYPHTIHTILDFSDLQLLPKDILAVRHSSPSLRHPRSGMVYVVTTSAFVSSIASLLGRLTNTGRIHVVRTEAQAWAEVRDVIKREIGETSDTRI